jgi:hypothetical protein
LKGSSGSVHPAALFVVIIAVAMLGVVPAAATWFRQRLASRRRQHEADAQAARAQLADLRAGAGASTAGPGRSASRRRAVMAQAGETSRARRCRTRGQAQGMIRKSGNRFSKQIMPQTRGVFPLIPKFA